MELQGRAEELAASGMGVVAISYDPVEVLAEFSERRGITFPLLSDVGSVTIREYGILNTVAEEGLGSEDPVVKADVERLVSAFGTFPFMKGIAYPGTFIVDPRRRVTSRFFEDYYQERSTASRIMLRLGTNANPVAGMEGSTEHLGVRTFQSNPEVAAGSIFTLGLEVTPNPGLHVYAPGAEAMGYRVIAIHFAENPSVEIGALVYPEAEIYHFVPLDEHVPVYQRPFTLTQDITVGYGREAQAALRSSGVLSLGGRLDYQACDDEKCFTPVSVPLTWSVAVAPPDSQRAQQNR